MLNDILVQITLFIKGLDPLSMYIGAVLPPLFCGLASKKLKNKSKLFIILLVLTAPFISVLYLLFPQIRGLSDEQNNWD